VLKRVEFEAVAAFDEKLDDRKTQQRSNSEAKKR